jgi:hypothetical protein
LLPKVGSNAYTKRGFISHGAHRATEHENLPFYTTDCLPCPYRGVQSPYVRLKMGKALKGKMNGFFFPSRAFSQTTVSNRIAHFMTWRTLRARALLRTGVRARDQNSNPAFLHSIARITVLCGGVVYGINAYVFSVVQHVMRENNACIIPLI